MLDKPECVSRMTELKGDNNLKQLYENNSGKRKLLTYTKI